MNKDMNKNLKDNIKDTKNIPVPLVTPLRDRMAPVMAFSYNKIDKLVTALYMVTDIIDKEEPIRSKLRILGTEIISDIHSIQANANSRIDEIMSFLTIASALNLISEMNCAILKKEFIELKESIQKDTTIKPTWLEEFFINTKSIGHTGPAKRQHIRTRIGVQRGSTLMKALSNINLNKKSNVLRDTSSATDFNILKKERRDHIINIIKGNGGNATIKDIMVKINTGTSNSPSFSEKTLQRELMSMIKDGVLNKTGEKRWSRYFVK